MQIRKTYSDVNPELLYDEVRDFVLKQGPIIGESKMGTYLVPDNTSSFIFRGNLTFKVQVGQDKTEKECLRVFDINDELFPAEKVAALEDDLNFIFEAYEASIDEDEI